MITQIDLIVGIAGVLEKLEPGIALLPRQMNAVIAAADSILAELQTPERTVRPGMGLSAWLASDCTGASSLYMAHYLANHWGKDSHRYAYPHDSGDFGRCLGLLDAVPELREKLAGMAETGREWAALIGAWDELEALHDCGEFQVLSDRIYELTPVRLVPMDQVPA